MNKKIFLIIILLFPMFVSAKNLDLLTKNWEDYCESYCEKTIVGETNTNIILATSHKTLEKYNKRTGEAEVLELGVNSFFEKIGENYLVFTYQKTEEENKYINKFALLDEELKKIKEYELTTEYRYFESMRYNNDTLELTDNYYNKYSIDENFNIVPLFDINSDGSYALIFGNKIVKYNKNHDEIKRIVYEKEASTDKYDLMKYENYFVVFYRILYYQYTESLYMCKYDLYLVNSELEKVNTYNDQEICNGLFMDTSYKHPYIRDPYGDYHRIDITNEKISLVREDPVDKDSTSRVDKDKQEFDAIFDSEKEEGKKFYYNYEKLDDNYLVRITWYDSKNSNSEYRYYDSNKKMLYMFDYEELEDIEIHNFISYYGKLGALISVDNSLGLVVLENDGTLLYDYDFGTKKDGDARIEVTDNGLILKHFDSVCLEMGIETNSMKGFPYGRYNNCQVLNLTLEYYELPYEIFTKTDGNGSVTAVGKSLSGKEITFVVKPKEGYLLDNVKVTDSYGNVITFTDYTFTMPSADVTIEATFNPIPVETPPVVENPLTSDSIVWCLIIISVGGIGTYINIKKISSLK